MRPLRTVSALAALMLASAVLAPAVGAFTEKQNSGNTGFYTIPDDGFDPGVKCKYENHPGKRRDEIDKIRIHSHWTHGPSTDMTWVGSQFIIKANSKPYNDGKFKTVYKSKILKDMGNDTEVANFKGRTWRTPENNKRRYRVVLKLIFYKKGSQTQVDGVVKGNMDVYSRMQGLATKSNIGTEGGPSGFCYQKWHAGPA